MVKKKSAASKAKTRRNAYVRKTLNKRITHSWRFLLTTVRAVRCFLRSKNKTSEKTIISSGNEAVKTNGTSKDFANLTNNSSDLMASNGLKEKSQTEDLNIVKNILKKIVTKVTRLDSERKRQLQNRERIKSLKSLVSNERSVKRIFLKNSWFRNKYIHDVLFRKRKLAKMAKYFQDKYNSNTRFHNKHRLRNKNHVSKKYRDNKDFREERRLYMKNHLLKKYRKNKDFREERRFYMKDHRSKKYLNNKKFREEHRSHMKMYSFKKYHSNRGFRDKHQSCMKNYTSKIYNSDHQKRLKKIQQVLNNYQNTFTPIKRNLRRAYNRNRRMLKKYLINSSKTSKTKHCQIYIDCLKSFRKLAKEGPDYVCVVCGLALFRTQVLPYVEEKYMDKKMQQETKKKIMSYISDNLLSDTNWICRLCSDKMKRQQLPIRALANDLEVSEIPIELRKLNNLERHVIALRLPFMKLVNLTSGKISNRFSQRGAVGPLHCVPSDVQDTVTILPRPVDKSMMIRLQLKRRLKYKAVWEEQLINPDDVRNALLFLINEHPAYKDIEIANISENYFESDKEQDLVGDNETSIEEIGFVEDEKNESVENFEQMSQEYLKRSALGDVNGSFDDDKGEDIIEDYDDNRTKYNVGTDCCIQPADFNDYAFIDRDPYVIAPAEKNKLSSLLTDNSIEKLAFPHLFPNGRGTYEEERETKISWKEYCKARLFSADNRFASDSSYIFFLQYLGDLRQVFSGINIAFRKKLPITAKESLDDSQMKFLVGKDMIYRHLQSVRGSPQFWHTRLKDLFGMNRQLNQPTFFFTLTSADLRWKEFVDVFARHTGEKTKDSYTFEEKTKLLRTNPVLAARMFERRLNNFMNLFIKGNACSLGPVEDWFYRIEMQMRGSPHAHMPLWVKDAPKYKGSDTDEKTREEIVKFCDKYITTYFPSRSEDAKLHDTIEDVQKHSRNHSKACLRFYKLICRFGFPRPVSRRTFICEPFKCETIEDKKKVQNAKTILSEMNSTMNDLEKKHELSWTDFDSLLAKYKWTYDDYEWALRAIHSRATIVHKRDPNARWVNQYNVELLRAWNANMDIQFILNPYACAKYLMSYTTKPEREMSLLLEATHKECREGNISVREEMKKLTGTFFNHRQISVQEAIYRATKMPLTNSSRGFVFVPAHSNSCRFLKPQSVLKEMDPDDTNIYMSNLADKYFDRPKDIEFDICMADFASEYEIVSINKKIVNPKTPIKPLQTLKFAVKKRCGKNAIIRYPYFNRENDKENYYETLLNLYLPIRSRGELKKPFELFYEKGELFDTREQNIRKVKDIVNGNRKKYEAYFDTLEEIESIFNDLSSNSKVDDWAKIVANQKEQSSWIENIEQEENPDFDMIRKKKDTNIIIDLKQTCFPTNDMKPLLESMNEEQQKVFYYVRDWCTRRLHNRDVEPLRLFITGGAGTGKSHLLKCLQYEATRIFSRKKHLEPDENIDEIHTLITAFTGAAAVNVGGVTIHSAFGISTSREHLKDSLSCDKLNSYRCKLGSLKLLFVDEVSLIQASLWGAMHSRLTQIMGIHSNTAIFGNAGIIAIGDFYQCSPVASSGIYSTLLWSDHFEYIELKINERQKNISFSETLNRIRKLKKKEEMLKEDRLLLEKCHQRFLNKEYHREAVHLFARNAEVDKHNNQMIEEICTNIQTFYETDCNGKELKRKESKQQNSINKPLRLALNARVMITKNICVSDGLANGVMGRVVGFIENADKSVSHIVIKCDSKTAGRLHRNTCSFCRDKDTICVTRQNDIIERQHYDTSCKSGTKQFPLRLSWALTVHKAQGLTVDEVVISTKDFFGTGMGYTALSRNRTSEGLFLADLYFQKFYCDKEIDKILTKMKPMKKDECIFQENSEYLNILFHNIEGLNSNFKAFQNHYLTKKADIICFVETWLTNKNDLDQYAIDGYSFLHRTRSSSFEPNHPLHAQKGGGVCIYYRRNIQIKEIDLASLFNFEFISIEMEKQNIIILTCYRSPRSSKVSFLRNLTSYLRHIDFSKRILIIGDFNEDSFQSTSNSIESHINTLGFFNIFKNISTTNNFTSLDCIYSNFIFGKDHYREVKGTFYSYHNALICSVNIQTENKRLTYETHINSDERMEITNAEHISISTSNCRTTTEKRKYVCKEIEITKRMKTTNERSTFCNSNSISKSKQIGFLQNINKLIKKSYVEKMEQMISLDQQLFLIDLKQIDVLGDGNCFFRAISHQLYGHEHDHMNIRLMSILYIEANRDTFASFINDEYSTIENYIDEMSNDETYADFLSILSTAITINKNIIIHELGKKPLLIPGTDYIEHQVHVSYDSQNLHYKSVTSIDDNEVLLSFHNLLCI